MSLTRSLIARSRDQEEGFTLIELMVVVLIIAILIAIAIPTFLGARQRAQDRATQSDLRNGLTAEKTVFTDAQTYDTDAEISAAQVETSLKWGTHADGGCRRRRERGRQGRRLLVGDVEVWDRVQHG